MKLELPPEITTPTELKTVRLELADYIGNQQHRAALTKVGTKPARSKPVSAELAAVLKAWSAPADLDDLAGQLDQLIAHASTITLSLPAQASIEFRQRLIGWLRTEIKPNLLVNLTVNPEIGGGVIIRTTNHVYDLSFKSRLLASRKLIPELVHRV